MGVDAWRKLPRGDYFVVVLILIVIATVGFLESVGVGIVIAVVLFVVNYSRIDVVKHALSGASHPSNVDRPRRHRRLLRQEGDQTFILELQGFLFFGTANNLFQRVRQRAADRDLVPLRYVVLDFRLVSGLDSSAVLSFVKMKQLADAMGLTLVLAHLSPTIREQLEKGGFGEESERLRAFSELDRGVEWCEDRGSWGPTALPSPKSRRRSPSSSRSSSPKRPTSTPSYPFSCRRKPIPAII